MERNADNSNNEQDKDSSAAADGDEIMTTAENTGNQDMVQDFSAAPNPNLNAFEGGEMDGIAYFRRLPCGYHFVPTDEELIQCYLKKKINHVQLPPNLIRDIDVNSDHPSQLATREYRSNPRKEWYFFTTITGSRVIKNVGYWKPTGELKTITWNNAVIIGTRRTLDFYEGKRDSGPRTNWKMHEYTVLDKNNMLENLALCKIYKMRRTKGGGSNSTEVEDDDNDHHCWKTYCSSSNPQAVNVALSLSPPMAMAMAQQAGTIPRHVSEQSKTPPQSSSMLLRNNNTPKGPISMESDVHRQQSSSRVFVNDYNPLLRQNPYASSSIGASFMDRNYNIGSSQYQHPYPSSSSQSHQHPSVSEIQSRKPSPMQLEPNRGSNVPSNESRVRPFDLELQLGGGGSSMAGNSDSDVGNEASLRDGNSNMEFEDDATR